MHENREILLHVLVLRIKTGPRRPLNRTADMNVQEKSGLCRSTDEPAEQRRTAFGGGRGGKGARLRRTPFNRTLHPDTEREKHVPKRLQCVRQAAFAATHPWQRAVCVNALIRICAERDSGWRAPNSDRQFHDESEIPDAYRYLSIPRTKQDQ